MKILTVSQFYTPDITAAAFRISETVSHLRSYGNEVEVITTFPHKSEDVKEVEASSDGVHRVRLPGTENKGFLGYIYLYVSFMLKSIIKGFGVGRSQNPDVVWASSPPIFVGLSGWVLAKLLGARFALDIRDIWPASAVAAGQLSDSGFGFKVGRWMEMFLYRHADVITCVANPMKEYIEQFTDTEVEVIYNGVEVSANDSKHYDSQNNPLNTGSSSRETKKMLYAGNFGHVQQLDILVNAFAEMNESDLEEEWEIFFLGGGAQKENLTTLVESQNLDECVHFLNPVPKEEVFNYLKGADALFIHLMDSEVLRLTIPSKVFDYMLADRPLLTGIHGEGKDIIESVEGNYTFLAGKKESLKKAYKKLDKNIGKNGDINNASVVRKKFSRESQSVKLNDIFNQLLNKSYLKTTSYYNKL